MGKPELVYVNHIKSTPEKVWQALTDPAFTARYWYGTRLESDWQVGSPITFLKPEGMGDPDRGKVLIADKPRTLSFEWTEIGYAPLKGERPSRATFTIEPEGDGVKLTLVHDQFDEASKIMEAMKNGWPAILAGLVETAEAGDNPGAGVRRAS